MKILFVLKDRFYNKSHSKSYGLINSSKQVAKYLRKKGHECKIVQVVDGNGIDKEVFKFKPNIVIFEALWVTGKKMNELINIPRYKNIKWVVRIHSDMGYLSAETLALKYVNDYLSLKKDNLFISCNNEDFNKYLSTSRNYFFSYLPNIAEINFKKPIHDHDKDFIDIGCFGALRLLKNQGYQAVCAIDAAEKLNKRLKFHISIDSSIDLKDSSINPILRNLEELFENSQHELIKHYWLDSEEFQKLISTMDLGLQLSYTESFNIVAADFVNEGIPIIVSESIKWMPNIMKTSTVNYEETINKIINVYKLRECKFIKWLSRRNMRKYNRRAQREWLSFIKQFETPKPKREWFKFVIDI